MIQWISEKMQKTLPPVGTYDCAAPKDIPIPLGYHDGLIGWRWYIYEASAVMHNEDDWRPLAEAPLQEINDPASKVVSDVIFFAYVEGYEKEAGSVSLRELQRSFAPFGSVSVQEYDEPLMLGEIWPYGG